MQHTLKVEIVEPIVEEIKEKFPKWELLELGIFWIFLCDLLIILSTMIPKVTFDQYKNFFDGMKRWYDVALFASYTVSI